MRDALTEYRMRRNACLRECQPWVDRMAHLIKIYGRHPGRGQLIPMDDAEPNYWPRAAMELYEAYDNIIAHIQRLHFRARE